MEISEYFLRVMRAKGLTLQKVADRLGTTRQNVHKVLKTRRDERWRDVEVARWSAALGVEAYGKKQ